MQTEIERIINNSNGEIPSESYEIFRIHNIQKPKEALKDYKKVILALLQNLDLNRKDEKWRTLFPPNLIKVIDAFEEEDYHKDDFAHPLQSLIYDFQSEGLREWEWYSSKLNSDGFEVYVIGGLFRIRYYSHARFLGIPGSSISLQREGKIYPLKLRNDVIVYKNLIHY